MNVMDGSVIGEPSVEEIAPAPLPSGQTFPVPGADYLSMDYLLVDGRKNVDVTMTYVNDQSSFDRTFAAVRVLRNYQTNIYDNLLTSDTDFHVNIDPIYEGSNSKDPDDPWSDYDLVLELSDDFKS